MDVNKKLTPEELLWEEFNINKDTKYHNYQYLYKSMIKSMEMYAFNQYNPLLYNSIEKQGNALHNIFTNRDYLFQTVKLCIENVTIPLITHRPDMVEITESSILLLELKLCNWDLINVIKQLEYTLNIAIPDDICEHWHTVADIINYLESINIKIKK